MRDRSRPSLHCTPTLADGSSTSDTRWSYPPEREHSTNMQDYLCTTYALNWSHYQIPQIAYFNESSYTIISWCCKILRYARIPHKQCPLAFDKDKNLLPIFNTVSKTDHCSGDDKGRIGDQFHSDSYVSFFNLQQKKIEYDIHEFIIWSMNNI